MSLGCVRQMRQKIHINTYAYCYICIYHLSTLDEIVLVSLPRQFDFFTPTEQHIRVLVCIEYVCIEPGGIQDSSCMNPKLVSASRIARAEKGCWMARERPPDWIYVFDRLGLLFNNTTYFFFNPPHWMDDFEVHWKMLDHAEAHDSRALIKYNEFHCITWGYICSGIVPEICVESHA